MSIIDVAQHVDTVPQQMPSGTSARQNPHCCFLPHTFITAKKLRIFQQITDKKHEKYRSGIRAKIINMIRDTIREAEPTAQIILYGSRARGDARENSDWDVLAIVDKPRLTLKDRSNIQYPIWDKGLDAGEEINFFSYTREQWEQASPSLFKHNVMNEGITL